MLELRENIAGITLRPPSAGAVAAAPVAGMLPRPSAVAMRALHVITALDPRTGGPIAAMLALAPAQQRAGASVSIAATYVSKEPEPVEALKQLGVRVEQIGP